MEERTFQTKEAACAKFLHIKANKHTDNRLNGCSLGHHDFQ